MRIKSIEFKAGGLFRRRAVVVVLEGGQTYKIKRAGAYAVVIPPCADAERDALAAVYKAAWEWLNGENPEVLDRGAKIACGRLVSLLAWPEDFTADTQTRLEYVVNKITFVENIF